MWQISEVRTFNELICKLQEKTGNQFRASIFSPNSAYEGVLINLYQTSQLQKTFLILLTFWVIYQSHSHKKLKHSLETRVIFIEISILCWNLPNGPKHWGTLQRNMAFPEGNKLFADYFCANLDETNIDMVQFAKNWKWIV